MRILVVEDDEPLAEILRRGLAEDGHALDVESTVAGADFALSVTDYDLLVLDLGLPDGDGLSLCRGIRDRGESTYVLVLTARDSLSDRVGGLDAGADDYMTKPFDFPELVARVRALQRRPSRTQSPVLEAGDLRIDPAAHRVWRGAVTVPLTPREFSLLHHLLAHRGEVVSRTDLIEHVWDANYDGLSNVVDAHVANLRRKLELPESPAPIETVRGVGYRIP